MAKPILDDKLWELIEPLIPVKPRRRHHPGRRPVEPRKVLTGILLVLRTEIPWEYLPGEMGCGSGVTCWRRLREWQEAGVWDKIHELLLAKLWGEEAIDLSVVAVDSSSVRAVGGRKNRPKPDGSGQERLQAPCCYRRRRHPARVHDHGRECP